MAALLRRPITSSAGVEEMFRERLARRTENFLWSVEHLIFASPNSPYRSLLDLAGYDLPEIRKLVAARGLDVALDQLREDGVYVRIQEFKGGEPTVRRGRTFRFQERDFANPSVRGILQDHSGGSRSRGTVAAISVEDLLDTARLRRWMREHWGLQGRDPVVWLTPGTGLQFALESSLVGRPPLRWGVLAGHRSGAGARLDMLAKAILVTVARLASRTPLPRPEILPAQRVLDLARYISRVKRPGGVLIETFVSSALRLVLAAEEAGIALGDVAFLVVGEPLTAAKRRQIEERGFPVFSTFGLTELGRLALLCPQAREPDDHHVLTDRVAVRRYPRIVDKDGATVPAYLLTSLLPHARHVMLNMETGDCGGLEERSCGCFMDRAGLRLHMHTIRSFEKLTAEGITYLGPSLISLLEDVLPREFGGDSRHYQLVESEDAEGFTRLYLLVSPHLGPLDEEALRRTVLREIGGRHLKGAYGRVVRRVWEDADTIQILRRDPLATAAGKILHLHLDRGTLHAEAT